MRGFADEIESPKYAHIERERRWLVDLSGRPSLDGLPYVLIEDLYVRGTRLRLRRMTDSAIGACSLKLTKKYDSSDSLARPIVTAYLSEAEFALLAGLAANALSKRRYTLLHDAARWSLDCFAAPLEGLELVEIEAPDAAALGALRPPPWAGKEVSIEPSFEGGALAARAAKGELWQRSS